MLPIDKWVYLTPHASLANSDPTVDDVSRRNGKNSDAFSTVCEFGIEKIRMDSDVCVVDTVTADDAFEI